MKIISYIIFLLPVAAFACNSDESTQHDLSKAPIARALQLDAVCENGIIPVRLELPSSYNGHSYDFGSISINNENISFEMQLRRFEESAGLHFCIDQPNLSNAKITIGYGKDECGMTEHLFIFDGLESILSEDRMTPSME